jgi:hypothetical protein
MICLAILTPIVTLVRTLIEIARQIFRTICDLVSSVVAVVKQVVEKVCGWLPWPLNKLCKWVTKLITVFETVWNWVCHTVIETIFEWIEIIVEYIIYILKWICWLVDWVWRGPELLLCSLGVKPRKFIGVCVKILADDAGNPCISVADALAMVRDASTIFRRCNIDLVVCGMEILIKPEYLSSVNCAFSGMFKRFFTWFSARTCGCCSIVTIYFVKDMVRVVGCSYPGADWIAVVANTDGTTIVHEIGHLSDLWQHTSDPDNIMTDQAGGTHDQLTKSQCCMIRTSRFVHFVAPCFRLLKRVAFEQRIEKTLGAPFKRKERGPCCRD